MTRRLLISYAHPDDESFGSGSLIARYTAEGAEVTLICATNGDLGSVDPRHLGGYDSVAALRLAELDCAASVLGLAETVRLGYRDSGMMGSPDNAHPESLWQAPLESVAVRIVEVIRRVRPQVILTFDPFGGYGHPDHIKIHRATLAAWEQTRHDPDPPRKLYYMAMPRALLRLGVVALRLMGRDPRRLGTNHDLDLQAILEHALPTHARIEVASYLDIGLRASACHASQAMIGETNALTRFLMRRFNRYALFTRAAPPPVPGEPVERDFFASLEE